MVSTKFRAAFCPGKSGASRSVSPTKHPDTSPRPHPPAPCPTVGWAPSEPLAWACITSGPSQEAASGPCWLRSKLRVRLPGTALSAWLSEELVRAAAFQGGVPREALPMGPGEGLSRASRGLGHWLPVQAWSRSPRVPPPPARTDGNCVLGGARAGSVSLAETRDGGGEGSLRFLPTLSH